MTWTPADIPDQSGRRAIVTGANSGLGLEIATELARAGAEVVLACRSSTRAGAAAEEIRRRVPSAKVEVGWLDLADLDHVREFAAAQSGRLDLLVNNAGLMAIDESRTAQGIEMQLGVNHFGHFALTAHLLPLLLETPGSRIGSQSSMGHRAARGSADPMIERPYDRWRTYFQSKLANLLFTRELHQRLVAAGSGTLAVTAHPGGSNTDLGTEGSGRLNAAMRSALIPVFTQSPALGARPMLRAMTDPSVRGGEFYGPRFIVRGAAAVRERPTKAARDDQRAHDLWEQSVRLTGVEPSFA